MDYNSKRWRKKSKLILKLDIYDQIEKRYGRYVLAEIVHHIYPADKYPEYAFCAWNLVSVTRKTHNRLHKRDSNDLSDEGKKLMNRTKIGIDWRKKKIETR